MFFSKKKKWTIADLPCTCFNPTDYTGVGHALTHSDTFWHAKRLLPRVAHTKTSHVDNTIHRLVYIWLHDSEEYWNDSYWIHGVKRS